MRQRRVGRRLRRRRAFLAEHAAFRAELIEVAGKKFDPKDGAVARQAAEMVGLVDIQVTTVDNDGTNGPRGIPNKGPATKLTTVTGLPDPTADGREFSGAGAESEAVDEPAAGTVLDKHAAAGGEQPAWFWRAADDARGAAVV